MADDGHAPRFVETREDEMTPEQRELHAQITGKRGKLPTPYKIWLKNPQLTRTIVPLGTYLAKESSLTQRERELAILVSARFWDASHPWKSHERYARELGVPEEAIAAIRAGSPPALADAREQIVCELAAAVHDEKAHVSDDLFERAVAALGHPGISDLIFLCANYTAVAMALNFYRFGAAKETTG